MFGQTILNSAFSDELAKFLKKRDSHEPPFPIWMGYTRTLIYNQWPLSFKWVDSDSDAVFRTHKIWSLNNFLNGGNWRAFEFFLTYSHTFCLIR